MTVARVLPRGRGRNAHSGRPCSSLQAELPAYVGDEVGVRQRHLIEITFPGNFKHALARVEHGLVGIQGDERHVREALPDRSLSGVRITTHTYDVRQIGCELLEHVSFPLSARDAPTEQQRHDARNDGRQRSDNHCGQFKLFRRDPHRRERATPPPSLKRTS